MAIEVQIVIEVRIDLDVIEVQIDLDAKEVQIAIEVRIGL